MKECFYLLLFYSIISIFYIYNNIIYLPGILYKWKNPVLTNQKIYWGKDLKTKVNINSKKNKLPNIILIIVDDLGINDLSINTPNINSLYQNGANFINAYSAQATCAPSRASIFTGKFPMNIGFEFTPFPKNFIKLAYYLDDNHLRPSVVNLSKLNHLVSMEKMVLPLNYSLISNVLHEYGYYNYFLGKWHIGEVKGYTPLDRGYDESLAFLYGASMYSNPNNKSIVTSLNEKSILDKLLNANLPFAVTYNNGPRFQPDEYMTDYLSNNVVKIIDSNKNNVNPFFITLAYNAPHNPYQALLSDYNSPEIQKLSNHNERVYYAMIKALDRGVGKIIESLKENNKLNDTMIIFTSDNGGAHYSNIKNSNKPYKGFKSTFFEGGIRVPLFIQYPKLIPKNSIFNKLSHHVDIFSTILSFVTKNLDKIKNNYEIDIDIDGINLFNYSEKHKSLFWKSGNYICLRHRNWKISLSQRPNKIWLFDLNLDPTEEKNLLETISIQKLMNSINVKHTNNSCSLFSISSKLFNLLSKYNSTSKTSLWNSVVEIPIPINDNEIRNEKDEYVYWSN